MLLAMSCDICTDWERELLAAMKPTLFLSRLYLVIVLLSLQQGIFGQTASESVQAITSALRGREYEKALQALQPALLASPNNPQLWMLQGLAHSGLGDSKSALASYQHALKISPDYLPAMEGAAQLEYEAGNADAIPLLERILKQHPEESTSHAMLAVLAVKNGDCASAAQHFAESGPTLDSQPGALQGFGVCLLKLKETEKAIEVFERLIAMQPNDPKLRQDLASVQLVAGKSEDALATVRPLLDSPMDVRTMRLAAAIYEGNKDTPNAVKILRDAIIKDPLQTGLYVDFAEIAMDHQSFQAGIEMIDAGLKLQPAAAPLYLARGVLNVQLAQYDKAEADFEKAEQLDPKLGMSAAAQGMLAEEQNQNDPDRALATVRAKLAKNPGDAFLWYLEAAIVSQKSPDPGSPEFEQGLGAAKKAVALQPSLTAAHNVLAKYYLDSGEAAMAVKECRLVLQQNPSDQGALYHIVIALRKTDNTAEIPELLKRLAKARQDATRQEGERNRYKLIVDPTGPPN
jgi:tetratricopeptide (TPR) repeat protein